MDFETAEDTEEGTTVFAHADIFGGFANVLLRALGGICDLCYGNTHTRSTLG